MADVAAAVKAMADKEAMDKRAIEETTVKEATYKEAIIKRSAEEAAMEEAKVGVARDSSPPPPARRLPQWRTPSDSAPPAKRPYKPRYAQFSCTLPFHLVARFSSK
jgi:hypothetical protein